jgi:phospholipid/cholesterol/gamma-HCH transport system ATP-binding protein
MRSQTTLDTGTVRPIIRVEDVSAAYDGEVVIAHISFEVMCGEIFFILGGSGCGKSTLLKHMIGLYAPTSGRILINDEDISSAEGQKRRSILRQIGVMYQSGALFGSMTLLENVRFPLEEFARLPKEAMDAVALSKLRLVGLEESAELSPAKLSGGMKKRAAIARALVMDPQIAFLDEPSAGLDPITSVELDELILRLSEALKVTFVIVTHELASAYAIADRVIMLDQESKGIVATGKPEELRDHSDHPWVRQFLHRQTS